MSFLKEIVEGFVLACLKYFCPNIYRMFHQESTIVEATTDPKLAKKYSDAYKEWQAKKDAKDANKN